VSSPASRSGVLLRVIPVALLVAGLVGMHQLGGGGHSMAAMTAAAGDVPQAMGRLVPPPRVPEAILAGAGRTGASLTSASDSASHSAPCLAVLLTALLLLPPALLGRHGTRVPVPLPVRMSSSQVARGPPRSLLAQLCVLRT